MPPSFAGFTGLPLTALDVIAVAWFVLVFVGYQNMSRIGWLEANSIAGGGASATGSPGCATWPGARTE